jgi:opacity protein-like surface antigen
MKRLLLTAAALAIAAGSGAAAFAQEPVAAGPASGALPGNPPAGAVAPAAPPGFQNVWVYSYDHHGYKGHWEAVRVSG